MYIAFTGHRPDKLGGYNDNTNFRNNILLKISKIFLNIEDPTIISGMALGVDTWVAEFAIINNIPLFAYIPFKGQEKHWTTDSQTKYNFILSKCSKVKYICSEGYDRIKMQIRNEAMVNDCNLLIAIWNGSSGGTSNCIKYAKKINKQMIIINPNKSSCPNCGCTETIGIWNNFCKQCESKLN